MSKKKILIAIAWPYVNGDLHIGHGAGYLIPADIEARYQRLIGNDVLMVSGSDCHGTPITVEADKRGVTPKEIADKYHAHDEKLLLKTLELSYDIYTRTDTEHHKKIVQDIFLRLLENGYITIGTSKQYYSDTQKRYLPDRYVEGTCNFCGFTESRSDQCDHCSKLLTENDLSNPKSKLTGDSVILKESQHYFVDWPKLQDEIQTFVKTKGKNWKNWVFRETMGWLEGEGLKPRAITRDIDWGIPVPADKIPADKIIKGWENKRIYVWFEAVIGYLSASRLWAENNGAPDSWKDFWLNSNAYHYYFMGKDNLPFHTIFWPGQLIGAFGKDIHLPDQESINMFLDLEGQKFSKSRGITLPMIDLVENFGNDPVRFYVTWIMPENKDSSFAWSDFLSVNNDLLIGNFGNFINRCLSMGHGTDMDMVNKAEISNETKTAISTAFKKIRGFLEKCEFRNYLNEILILSDFGNKYIDRHEVYKIKSVSQEKYSEHVKQMYSLVLSLAFLISPLMPKASENIFSFLGINQTIKLWPENNTEIIEIESLLRLINNSKKPKPIFKKLTPEDIEDFKKKLSTKLSQTN